MSKNQKMMNFRYFLPVLGLLTLLVSCVEERINLSDLSDEVRVEREIAAPIIRASFLFDDFAGNGADSLIINALDTIKLFNLEDIRFQDTVSLGELGEDIDFEYINLYHTVTNMFPVGLDLRLYMYDSISAQNIDTIWFSNTPGELFLQPAPLNEDELVIEEQVQEVSGVIYLDTETFDNLFENSSHLVIDAVVPSSSGFARILSHYTLNLNLGIEAKGYYTLTPEEEQQ